MTQRIEVDTEFRERVNSFLVELAELSTKYGLKICGCGCMGSPWLEECGKVEAYILEKPIELGVLTAIE